MNRFVTLLLSILYTSIIYGQSRPIVVNLWPNGAPNDNMLTENEYVTETGRIRNVSNPQLFVFPAHNGNGVTVIQCPGGGYMHLAIDHEGLDMADWYNRQGITYAVLKYRMPNGNIECSISDALQAIKIMRSHSAEWNVNPNTVGISGCSAGGNLASLAATHYTSSDDRPDFQILFYAFTDMDHRMQANMVGNNPTAEFLDYYSSAKQITPNTPPAFIHCCADDKTVPCENSIRYFQALKDNNVSATLHIYPIGGHGWGFRDLFTYKREWTQQLERWLLENFILKKPSTSINEI